MTKGSYTMGENSSSPTQKDTSFRSFICVLLIFLFICLIILLASIGWGGTRRQPGLQHDETREASAQKIENNVEVIDKVENNRTFEKIREFEESTTRRVIGAKEIEDEVEDNDKKITLASERFTTVSFKKGNDLETTTFVSTNLNITVPSTTKKEDNASTQSTKDVLLNNIEDSETITIKQNSITSTTTGTTLSRKEKIEITTEVEDVLQEKLEDSETTTSDQSKVKNVIITTESGEIPSIEDLPQQNVKDLETTTIIQISPSTNSTTSNNLIETTSSIPKILTSKDWPQQNLEDLETTTNTQDFTSSTATATTVSTDEKDEIATEIEDILQQKLANSETTTSHQNKWESVTTPHSEDVLHQNVKILETTTTIQIFPPTNSTTSNSLLESTYSKLTNTTVEELKNISSSTTEVSIMESEPFTEPLRTSWTKTSNPVCNSNICKTSASQILGMMNHSSEPCVDFYEFSCGHANNLENINSDFFEKIIHVVINDNLPKHIKDFKRFYQSCLEYENDFNYSMRMEGLEGLLKEVGHFRIQDSTPVDLTELVSKLILRQSMPLFDIGIDIDKQSAEFILVLTIPQQSFLRTGLEDWAGLLLLKQQCLREQKSQIFDSHINLNDIYKSYQDCQTNYASYLNSIENVIRGLSIYSNLDKESLFKEIKDLRFSIEFEILNNLDNLPSPAGISEDFINKKYSLRKVSDLQQHYPIFDWKKLFEILIGKQVSDNTLVQVYFQDYFQIIFKKLFEVDRKKLNNAFLAIYAYDLYINTVIPKEQSNRNLFCINLSKKLLPDIFSSLVNNIIPIEDQKKQNDRVRDLFQNLKNNFCSSLFNAEWIDDDTKISIVNKCNNLNLTFFVPPKEETLIRDFNNINLSKNYQTNLLQLMKNFKHRIFSKISTPITSETIFSYFLDPLNSKPLTFYASPLIAVPLGMSKKASSGLPSYLQEARIGFSLARQLSRHFDPTGIKYGINLISTSSYTYADLIYSTKTLMDDSSPRLFQSKNISFDINGLLSVNERIVDNAAFRLIYDSVKFTSDEDILPWISTDYSREKIFFIAVAQEFCKKTTILDFMLQVFEERHLPPVLRVKNIMGNSEDFVEKFSCPEGSDMDLSLRIQFPFLTIVEEEDDEASFQ